MWHFLCIKIHDYQENMKNIWEHILDVFTISYYRSDVTSVLYTSYGIFSLLPGRTELPGGEGIWRRPWRLHETERTCLPSGKSENGFQWRVKWKHRLYQLFFMFQKSSCSGAEERFLNLIQIYRNDVTITLF